MINAIIIEDEINASNLLCKMLQDIDNGIVIKSQCGDIPSGVLSIRKHKPDVVFLDIELPVYSGIQLLDFFAEDEINFSIVFTTAYNQYAIKAFEMSAVDYLLKPIQHDKLQLAIHKLRNKISAKIHEPGLSVLKQNLSNAEKKKIVLPVSDGVLILNVDEILYIRAEGSYSKIFMKNKEALLFSKNLKHFEYLLSDNKHFIRVHRSFIANLNFSEKLSRSDGGTLVMINNIEIPVSTEMFDDIVEALKVLR